MSCRRGVPKNDCSCCKSLAEKVRELWERAANAIKTINGVQADGANNFDILPGAGIQVNPRANGIEIVATGAAPQDVVKSVNGETPDEDGNVAIDTGLLTVNTIAPDADGEFSISAGSGIQINAGDNGIEIENTSQGAIYTGEAPIIIDSDNKISLAGFTQVATDAWAQFATGWPFVIQKDLLLQIGDSGTCQTVFLPKGFKFTNNNINIVWSPVNWSIIISDSIWLRDIFKNGNNYAPSADTQRRITEIVNNTSYMTINLGNQIPSSSITIRKNLSTITTSYNRNRIELALWVRE